MGTRRVVKVDDAVKVFDEMPSRDFDLLYSYDQCLCLMDIDNSADVL